MRNSPWIHQPRSESAPAMQPTRDPPPISKKDQDEVTSRVSRPTESALYRKSLYWKLDSFMDRGFHSWTKMNLFKDWKNCMWTPVGAIKTTYKLRPHKLPVLNSRSGDDCGTPRPGQLSEREAHSSYFAAKKYELSRKRGRRDRLKLTSCDHQDVSLTSQRQVALPCIH